MLLIVFFIAGLLIGMFRRGGLSGLVRIRGLWLILVSVAAERSLTYLPLCAPQLFPAWTAAFQLARFAPLLLFALLNVKDWRMCLAGLGIALNFAVIAANGWRMPVSWDAPAVQGLAGYASRVQAGAVPAYMLMDVYAGANLWFLSDIIPLNFIPSFPLGYMSAGDLLLSVGLMLAVQHGMAKYSIGKHARGSLAKHLYEKPGKGRTRRRPAPASAPRPERAAGLAPTTPEPPPAFRPEPGPEFEPEIAPEPEYPPAYQPDPEPVSEPEPSLVFELQPRPAFDPEPEHPFWPNPAPAQILKPEPTLLFELEPAAEPAAEPGPVRMPESRWNIDEPAPPPWEPEPIFNGQTASQPGRLSGGAETAPSGFVPDGLPPRLEAVAGLIPRGAVVADVGCDHGKLAAGLAMSGAPFVVALDSSAKSLAKTRRLVDELNLQHAVQTRVSDGLKKLDPGEADVIVIAGLGGSTICSILEDGYNVAGAAVRLVLQPMNAVGDVRRWLADSGFRVVAEELAEDDGRIYQILAAEPGSDARPPMSLFDLEVGRLLIENRHPLLPKLLGFKIATINKILGELAGNDSSKAEARRDELMQLKGRCEEVLDSL
jgi:tRNA (adenine22-N1)-methyltransferase